jgi:RNase P/RNase MRP subunit p30
LFNSNDDELNRKVLEKLPINILAISLSERKDFSKQRNSGFNQVMAKIANKKNISLGIFLDELVLSEKRERILARVIQNVFLCKKYSINIVFIEGKIKRDLNLLKSFMLVLGLPTKLIKNLEIISLVD